jgi:hypothetical protein
MSVPGTGAPIDSRLLRWNGTSDTTGEVSVSP